MPIQDILSYSSFAIGVFGIFIAFYQGFERKKLKQYVHSQAWHIYSMSNVSVGSLVLALKSYKEVHQDNISPPVLEQLSKCEAFGLSLFMESIRQIHLSEPKFNLETITQWAMQGKIQKDHMPYFMKLMPMDHPSIIAMIWNSFTLKIKQKCIASMNPTTEQVKPQQNSD